MMKLQENQEFKIGKDLFAYSRSKSRNLFSKNWLKNQFLKLASANPKLQQQLFHFVDVLPVLKSKDDITKYLTEYLNEADHALSYLSSLASRTPIIKSIYRKSINISVNLMAHSFICGSNIKEAKKQISKLKEKGQSYTLDILGELTVSDSEAKKYFAEYRDLIANLERPNLSIKISALAPQINNINFSEKKELLRSRLRIIFREAQSKQGFINIDTEHFYWKDFTFDLIKEILLEPEFKNWDHVGIVVQAYLKSSEKDLKDWVSWANKRGKPISIRLVKGAYWDYETAIAIQHNWDSPVFEKKYETDINYEKLAIYLLENYRTVRPAFASHNFRSLSVILARAENLKIDKSHFELQMLYGMLDELKDYFSERGYKLRVYMPYGELIPGMAYLVRRLLENTANDSFLKQGFLDERFEDELLVDPKDKSNKLPSQDDALPCDDSKGFENAANLDFSIKTNREKMLKSIQKLRTELQEEKLYPILVSSKERFNDNCFESVNPAKPSEILGRISKATTEDCDEAAQEADKAFKIWSKFHVDKRADTLEYIASRLEKKRFEFNALMCLEAGKPWVEADGEFSEAVDFLRYYAKQARELFSENKLRSLTGERNTNIYQSYGVALIVSPWNFPLAILCGMTCANLVCGNPVLIKPSSQSAIIAYEFVKILKDAILSLHGSKLNGLINFLPGEGRIIGDHLVSHPLVKVIAFTGSNATGMRINDLAGKARPVKKLVAEMGGKNAIIVDENADLDEAVPGVIYSAFGYAGQKCSACSRLIILDHIYDDFMHRLKEAMEEVSIGEPEFGESYMGPQIDMNAQFTINKYIDQGKREAKIFFGRAKIPQQGFFVSPTIFVDLDDDSKLAQEEIFGPVLVVFKARDLDHALKIANNSSFGLTGGFYSRSPKNITKVSQEFQTGNLYINRSCTGAIVSRQAFGGLKESSLGYKAGGPNYLLNFVQEKTITENTMRRGFAAD